MNDPCATLLPRILKTPIRLVVRNGWNDDVTAAFKKEAFEQLILQGTKDQPFEIPPLGAKSVQIQKLQLKAAGDVTGLGQFSGVLQLGVSTVPRNGLDLDQFPILQSLSFEWDERIAAQLDRMLNLASFECDRYPHQTLEELAPLAKLQTLAIGRGRLRSLQFISHMLKLQTVSIGNLRSFDSLDEIYHLKSISQIWLNDLPELKGTLELRRFDDLKAIYVVNTPLLTDLTDIGNHDNLEMVWLNGSMTNLDWDELLAIESLRKVGIVEADADNLPVNELAERAGRSIESLKVVGPKNRRQIQLNFV